MFQFEVFAFDVDCKRRTNLLSNFIDLTTMGRRRSRSIALPQHILTFAFECAHIKKGPKPPLKLPAAVAAVVSILSQHPVYLNDFSYSEAFLVEGY